MNLKEKAVQLSAQQLLYLRNTAFLPPALSEIVEAACAGRGDSRMVCVSRKVAEQFRSSFTDRLAKVGFDTDYKLTREGQMLEELIDCFYMPENH